MSIRSYKDIYARFAGMFPELNCAINTWKGVRFAERHIAIYMNDGCVIDFFYKNSTEWSLTCHRPIKDVTLK